MKKQLLICIIIMIIIMTGCSNKNQLVISQNCVCFDYTSEDYYSTIIHSYDELKNICEELDNHYLDKDYVYDDSCSEEGLECNINQARQNVALRLQTYHESFFKKKDLVVYELHGNPYGYYRYELACIKYNGDNVSLTLKEREKRGVKFDIWYSGKHLIVVEIDKRDNYENKNIEVIIKKGRSFSE